MPVIQPLHGFLKQSIVVVDTVVMAAIDFQFDVLDEHARNVLEAYVAREAILRTSQEQYDGWQERLDQLDGFDTETLTSVHGQLIAQGMLKFELTSRSVGLRYQISQRARQALSAAANSDEHADAEDLSHADADDDRSSLTDAA